MHLTGRLVALTLEGALLLVLIAGAAYVSMGRILVANIAAFEDIIEDRASAGLNVPVSLEGIAGSWDYLDPTLTLTGMRLGDSVWIGNVSARVNAVQSLLERGLVVSEVAVDGLELRVAQQPDGSWQIDGLAGGGGGFDASPLIRSLVHLKRVNVSGVDVRVDGQTRQYRLRNQAGTAMQLLEEGEEKLLSMPLSFQDSAEADSEFELIGRYRGDPRDIEEFNADLYLQLPLLELSDFLPPRDRELTPRRLTVHGEFWLRSANGEWDFRAKPVVEQFVVGHRGRDVELVSGLEASVFVQGSQIENARVQIPTISGIVVNESFELSGLEAAFTSGAAGELVAARLSSLDLAVTIAAIRRLGDAIELLDETALETMTNLNPRGSLDNLHALVRFGDNGKPMSWRVAARLRDVSIDSNRNSPIVREIDGVLALGPDGGHLDLIDDPFGITFPPAYSDVWQMDGGSGRLSFSVANGYPQIDADLLRVTQGAMTAAGRLRIDLREAREDRTWVLELGVLAADLLDAWPFVPNTVDAGLTEWLGRAVLAGTSERAGMIFHGTLDQSAPDGSKAFELFFDVDNTTLEYDSGWPAVAAMDGIIYVSNRGVFSTGVKGVMLESTVLADVSVPMSRSQPPDGIRISGGVSGDLANGLRVLQETPLAAATGQLAREWQGTGAFDGQVTLNIPIGPREGEPVAADVEIDLSGNSINMGEIDLAVEDINSRLRYTTTRGLSAEAFTASLFGSPVTGKIVSDATEVGGAVRLSVEGKVGTVELAEWSGQRLLQAAEGLLEYDAVLHVPYGERAAELAYVEAKSSLEGVSVNLPPPLAKPAEASRQFVYRQSFLKEGFRVDLALDDVFRASLKSVAGEIKGGAVRFGGGSLGAVAYDDLDVMGRLEFADYAEWEDASRYFEREDGQPTEVAGMLDSIDLYIESLIAFGVELDQVQTQITRDPGLWKVGLSNSMLHGTIDVADADEPIRINLDYLRLPAGEEGDLSDPLADIDPRELTRIQFETSEFAVGEDEYGQWSFLLRPTEEGAVLEGLSAKVRGLMLDDASKLEWKVSASGMRSRFTGEIDVPDLASAFRQWGFASSVEGKDMRLKANLSWAGSPAMVDLYNVQGPVDLLGGSGRFVQAESGTGALRVLGIFDFASLARRLQFDFSDVINSGFSFSEVTGRVRLNEGVITVTQPIEIVGSGSKFKVGGTVDLETNTLDNDMIVTLPVSRNLPWYAAYSAIVTGPLVGAGVWLANKIFENQIDQMSSAKYRIEGTIDKPVVEFVSIFDDSVREAPEELEPIAVPPMPTTSSVSPPLPPESGSQP